MAQTVKDVMTTPIATVEPDTTVQAAARRMREEDVGALVVETRGDIQGIVTDRDIVVRAVAGGRDPARILVRDVCSGEIASVGTDQLLERAIGTMRDRAVRRTPVVEGGRPVGILSIGDLAIERDEDSALATISVAAGTTRRRRCAPHATTARGCTAGRRAAYVLPGSGTTCHHATSPLGRRGGNQGPRLMAGTRCSDRASQYLPSRSLGETRPCAAAYPGRRSASDRAVIGPRGGGTAR
ncbi:MAG: CBS domain-containing protein [Acidimicrobiales bacterium]